MAGPTPTPPTRVMANRARSIGFASLLGAVTVAAAARGAAAHSTRALVIALVVGGVPCAFFVAWGVRKRPVLVIDDHALTEGRSRRVVPWDSITAIRVGTQQGMFGESHHLVLTLEQGDADPPRRFITTNATNQNELDIGLDWLAMPWKEVVSLVEQHFGRRATLTTERPFRAG
jgi:hypothetical protein